MASALCDGLFALHLIEKSSLLFFLLLKDLILSQGVSIRVNNNSALHAVYDCKLSVDVFRDIYLNKCRDVHRTGKDRCMRVRGATSRDKCKDHLLVELNRL